MKFNYLTPFLAYYFDQLNTLNAKIAYFLTNRPKNLNGTLIDKKK